MQLSNSFTVPVSIDRAWDTLLDMEKVAPCLPGAAVDSFDGQVCEGRVKVKVGPISLQYRGEVTIDQRDDANHTLVMTGLGKEIKGASAATAKIRAQLRDEGAATSVHVETDLDLTGKPAQFGRGIIADVSNRLVAAFATNLESLLTDEKAADSPVAVGDLSAIPTVVTSPAATEPEALDALSLLPAPVRRLAPVLGGVLLGLVLGLVLRRR